MKTLIEKLVKKEKRYQVKFDNETGYCTLIDRKYKYPKQFAGVSELLNYCRRKGIDVAIEDCVVRS